MTIEKKKKIVSVVDMENSRRKYLLFLMGGRHPIQKWAAKIGLFLAQTRHVMVSDNGSMF